MSAMSFDDKVLRDFMPNGRLKTIPARAKKKDVVLRYLVTLFEPDRRYHETEVNAVIQRVHPDYASLRRFLVDAGLLARDHGIYWRVETPEELTNAGGE